MDKIKEILKGQIEKYKSWKIPRDDQDIDIDSLYYDEAYTLFHELDRGQCQQIMEELIK